MTDNTEHPDVDLGELDQALGSGPAHRQVDERVVAGRRALWRRRAVTGLTSVAVVAVIGTTFALVAGPGGDPTDGSDGVAAGPEKPADALGDTPCTASGSTGGGSSGDPGPATTEVPPNPGAAAVPPDPNPEPPVSDPDQGGTLAAPDPAVAAEATLVAEETTEGPVPDNVCCAIPSVTEVEVDPAPGIATDDPLVLEPLPGEQPEGDVFVVDCGFDPDGVPSTSSGYGTSDGTVGGTRVGPLGDDEDHSYGSGQAADIDSRGELVLADGVEVTERIDNPLGLEAPDHSLAVEVVQKHVRTWLLLGFVRLGKDCGQWSFTSQGATAGGSLQDWVDGTTVSGGDRAEDKPACAGGTASGSATSGSVGKP